MEMHNERHFSPEDLQPGDIICWETWEDCPIETLVGILSGEHYSHSAFVSGNAPKVFEQNDFGCVEHDFLLDETRWGRRTTVTRLEGIDVNAILDVAQTDVDSNETYAFNNLAYLAVILLLNDPSILLTATQPILEGVISFIKFFIDYGGMEQTDESTFCSEFVNKCYKRAGIELEIQDPTFERNASFGSSTILDLVKEGCSEDGNLSGEAFEVDSSIVGVGDKNRVSAARAEIAINNEASKLLKLLKEEKLSKAAAHSEETTTTAAVATTRIDKKKLVKTVVGFALISEKDKLSKIRNYKQKVLTALDRIDMKYFVTPGELTRIKNKNAVKVGSFVIPKQG